MTDHQENPTDLFDAMTATTVVCIGDIMLDRFIHGSVDRISPEAPIPVLKTAGETAMLGGAGNVLRGLRAIGAQTTLVCVIGRDEDGDTIAAQVADIAGPPQHVVRDPDRRTSVKCRYIAGSQQLLRTDAEDTHPLSQQIRTEIIDSIRASLENAGAAIVSDYGKGAITDETLAAVIESAKAKKIPVIIDPVGRDYRRYHGATLLTPNRKELFEATGLSVDSDADLVAAARHIIETCNVEQVLVTRGAEGMTLVNATDPAVTLPARAREVFDVSGAGDTVAAVMAAALATGATTIAAMELANAAAGVVVGKVGTATASRDEILEQLTLAAVRGRSAKIKTDADLQELVAQWRRQGLTIGFTNGCFDVVHPGHVSLLAQAAETCDRLIVALNTDASVQVLKGPNRPVQSETARARVIASLADVDAVVLFGDDTPMDLIRRIRPDALVKGADYTIETVVGSEFVQSYGGRIVLAQLEDGYSTTAAIARMAK